MNTSFQVAIGTAILGVGGVLGLTPPFGELDLEQESDPVAPPIGEDGANV
jgi:hypothetical protein